MLLSSTSGPSGHYPEQFEQWRNSAIVEVTRLFGTNRKNILSLNVALSLFVHDISGIQNMIQVSWQKMRAMQHIVRQCELRMQLHLTCLNYVGISRVQDLPVRRLGPWLPSTVVLTVINTWIRKSYRYDIICLCTHQFTMNKLFLRFDPSWLGGMNNPL